MPADPAAAPLPAHLIAAVRQSAYAMVADRDADGACDMLDQALRQAPGHSELLGDLAAIRLGQGRLDDSIAAARAALRADPSHDESAYALATALAAQGQAAEALAHFAALATGGRAARFARQQPLLAQRAAAEATRLSGRPAAAAATPPTTTVAARPAASVDRAGQEPAPPPSTRFRASGAAKYQIDHLDQPAHQGVGGPIQDDEALLLYALVRTMRLRRVLEIGGLDGYSARNWLAALGDETGAAVYTVDLEPVPSQGPNHHVITRDCARVGPQDLHFQPLDLIFFDAHVLEAQMALLGRLEQAGLVQPHTVIALHDTGLHPRKMAPWAYRIVDGDGQEGWVHQPVERVMVNRLRERGWDALCLHMGHDRSDERMPVRHGLTLMQRFRPLPT